MTKILALPGQGELLNDRYELVAELAQGGMATVYLARVLGMADFKRLFAIKRLHPHLASEPEFISMFLDEARLAARLHHPNVVPIIEIGISDSQHYLVMDYIEGDTAGRLVVRAQHDGRKLPIGFTTRVVVELLTGLHAAHELTDDRGNSLEIVHRDVSPQNILGGVDGVTRITDFGVARAAARLQNQTQGGQLKGKLAYMAPEQVRGSITIDRRADVFAAGIVLWEMLTARRLFKAESDAETLFRVVAAEVPPLSEVNPEVSQEIADVCHKALAKEPADRYQTAGDFADALEHAARASKSMFTVRESATLVNALIGMDIKEQRDIVRAWLAQSDVSKSGVARSETFARPPQVNPHPGIPLPPPPPPSSSAVTPPPPRQMAPAPAPEAFIPTPGLSDTNLGDDDEDMQTRTDGEGVFLAEAEKALAITNRDEDDEDEDAATRMDLGPEVAAVMKQHQEAQAAAQGEISIPINLATSPEFRPFALADLPVIVPPPSPTSTANLPAATDVVLPEGLRPKPIPKWVYFVPIPVVLIALSIAIGVAIGGSSPPPAPSATPVNQNSSGVSAWGPSGLPAIATTLPPLTATATATVAPTASSKPVTTSTGTVKVAPPVTATTSTGKKPPIDNHEFGGRK